MIRQAVYTKRNCRTDLPLACLRLQPPDNLFYYRARYYDATDGRFTSEDPIGLDGGGNVYRYVLNNPVIGIDPHGTVTVVPLPEANYHILPNIDASCASSDNPSGITAGGCNKAGYGVDWKCEGCENNYKAKVTITLTGSIFIAQGPFPYLGRRAADRSVRDTASARRHEELHTQDKLNAIQPIFETLEAQSFKSKAECEAAAEAAAVRAAPLWDHAATQSQRRRH